MANFKTANTVISWAEKYEEALDELWQGDVKRGLTLAELAMNIATELELAEEVIDTYILLGDAQRLSGQHTAARRTLESAIAKCEQDEALYEYRALALAALGKVHMELGGFYEAIGTLESAVEIFKRNRREATEEWLPAFFSLIACYTEKESWQTLDKHARYTHELSQSLLGDDDAATLTALMMCAVAAEAQGRNKRAQNLHVLIQETFDEFSQHGFYDELQMAPSMMQALGTIGINPRVVLVFEGGAQQQSQHDAPHEPQSEPKPAKVRPNLRIVK